MADYQDEAFKGKHIAAKTILIVEDDTAFGDFLCNALEQETPHQTLCVPDGLQALDVVKEVTPDLIILDYYLPNMNGIELYDRLHAINGLEHVPTIMTSAGVLEHNLQGRHIVGMSKPVGLNKLLDMVTELID
jgi:CheY-like chemotaxis protein